MDYYMLEKVKVKLIISIGKFDETKILIDINSKLTDEAT